MSLLEPTDPNPPAPTPLAPPIATYALRRAVGPEGTPTELVVQTFDDRVLVVVSQSGKVGCLTQASLPAVHPLLPPSSDPDSTHPSAPDPTTPNPTSTTAAILPPPPASIALTPLLGAPPNPPLHDLYVSQIATLVWWALQMAGGARRPVVVGLALKGRRGEGEGMEGERERFVGVMEMVAGWEPSL